MRRNLQIIVLATLLVAVCAINGDQPNPYGLDHRALPYFRHRYLDFMPRFHIEECVIRIGYAATVSHHPADEEPVHFTGFYSEIDLYLILEEPKAFRVEYVDSMESDAQRGEFHVFFADECDRRRAISDGIMNTLASKHPDYTFTVVPGYDADIVNSRMSGEWLNGDDDILSDRILLNRAYGGDPDALLALASRLAQKMEHEASIVLPHYYQYMTLASCRLTDGLLKYRITQRAEQSLTGKTQHVFPLYQSIKGNTEILIYILERLLPQVWSVRACLGKQRTVP